LEKWTLSILSPRGLLVDEAVLGYIDPPLEAIGEAAVDAFVL